MPKFIPHLLLSTLPLLVTVIAWLIDGARLSLWATSIQLKEEVPIVEGMPELGTQIKITWVEQFQSGLETPFIGLCLSFIFFLIQIYKKRSLKNTFS